MMNITRVDIACVSVFCPGLLSLLSRLSPRSEIKEIYRGEMNDEYNLCGHCVLFCVLPGSVVTLVTSQSQV